MTTEIVFRGVVPGNNGKNGLIRMNRWDRTALKNNMILTALAARNGKHPGPVRMELVRHSIGSDMDYDNLVSTGKLILDAIVKANIIIDDRKTIIVERDYSQTRAINRQSQMTVVSITDI